MASLAVVHLSSINWQSLWQSIRPSSDCNTDLPPKVDSPIAKGLLGKKLGEIVEIEVPVGKLSFEVVEISR